MKAEKMNVHFAAINAHEYDDFAESMSVTVVPELFFYSSYTPQIGFVPLNDQFEQDAFALKRFLGTVIPDELKNITHSSMINKWV